MSTNLNYKQVANVERRTWDVAAYEQRAKERAKNESAAGAGDKKKKRKHDKSSAPDSSSTDAQDPYKEGGEEQKEEFQRAAKGAAGPAKSERAFLKARRNRVDVDSKIGSVEIINPEAVATTKAQVGEPGSIKDGVTKTGVGWHCKVCDCFLRDSHTYLDHINGRKHQRNLGYSMRVERSTKDQVASRLALLAQEKEKQKQMTENAEEDFQRIVMAKDEEEQRRREERAKQRKERRKMIKAKEDEPTTESKEEESKHEDNHRSNNESVEKNNEEQGEEDDEEEDIEEEECNPDMAALMGFSGFGGGNKNR